MPQTNATVRPSTEKEEDSSERLTIGSTILTDERLIEKATKASNGDKFDILYSEEWPAPGLRSRYDTERAAQLALLVHLRWWTRHDLDQVERLFKAAALYPGDWEQNREKYRELLDTAGELLGDDCYSASGGGNDA